MWGIIKIWLDQKYNKEDCKKFKELSKIEKYIVICGGIIGCSYTTILIITEILNGGVLLKL